jgi:hypothetical protein
MTQEQKSRPHNRKVIPRNGFWICRDVDPWVIKNEYYDNWQEFQYVDSTAWKRICSYQHRMRNKWRIWKKP